MTSHNLYRALLVLAAAALAVYVEFGAPDTSDDFPNRPIKVVVPFNAGGGSDTFSRIVAKAVKDNNLLPQPLVIINRGGAGATVGSSRVKSARPDGYTILMLHEAILTAKYSGMVNYGPEAFEPIAGTGELPLVIVVKHDAPYQSLDDLTTAAYASEEPLVWASNPNTPSHFAGLLLEKESARLHGDAKPKPLFRYSQVGGGADRLRDVTSSRDNTAVATAFSMEEYVRFQPDGVRALAVCSPRRHPASPETPTTHEQGYELTSVNMQFWWAPKGTPQDRIRILQQALRRAMATSDVVAALAASKTDPVYVDGQQLWEEVHQRDQALARVDLRKGMPLPNLPLYLSIGIVGLAAIATWQRRGQGSVATAEDKSQSQWTAAVIVFAFVIAYVALLGWGGVRFRYVTSGFVFLSILVLSDKRWSRAAETLAGAVLIGFGIELLFTRVFVIDLP